jgi:hypothetical protein
MREYQIWEIESDHLVQQWDTSQSFQTNPTNDHMVCFHYLNHKCAKVTPLTQLEYGVDYGQEHDVAPAAFSSVSWAGSLDLHVPTS